MTTSGEPIRRLYSPLDVADLDYLDDLGNPGEYPYTRGVHSTLYRGKPWTMRMFAVFGSAEETNAKCRGQGFFVAQEKDTEGTEKAQRTRRKSAISL